MLMVMVMLMIMSVMMLVSMFMVMFVVMLMSMFMVMPVFIFMSVQIRHIVVMIFMVAVKPHQKIAHVQPGLFYAGNLRGKPAYGQAGQDRKSVV